MTAADEQTQTVVVERDLAHPPEKVWRALTEPHLIAEWLMKNDFSLTLGHRFQLKGDWGGVLDCEVLTIEPNRRLAYSWDFRHQDPAFDLKSVVTLTLTPTNGGTRLRMEQEGFRPGQKQAIGGARSGWTAFLGKLEGVLDRLEEA